MPLKQNMTVGFSFQCFRLILEHVARQKNPVGASTTPRLIRNRHIVPNVCPHQCTRKAVEIMLVPAHKLTKVYMTKRRNVHCVCNINDKKLDMYKPQPAHLGHAETFWPSTLEIPTESVDHREALNPTE